MHAIQDDKVLYSSMPTGQTISRNVIGSMMMLYKTIHTEASMSATSRPTHQVEGGTEGGNLHHKVRKRMGESSENDRTRGKRGDAHHSN